MGRARAGTQLELLLSGVWWLTLIIIALGGGQGMKIDIGSSVGCVT